MAREDIHRPACVCRCNKAPPSCHPSRFPVDTRTVEQVLGDWVLLAVVVVVVKEWAANCGMVLIVWTDRFHCLVVVAAAASIKPNEFIMICATGCFCHQVRRTKESPPSRNQSRSYGMDWCKFNLHRQSASPFPFSPWLISQSLICRRWCGSIPSHTKLQSRPRHLPERGTSGTCDQCVASAFCSSLQRSKGVYRQEAGPRVGGREIVNLSSLLSFSHKREFLQKYESGVRNSGWV